jgi:hypothetical protein
MTMREQLQKVVPFVKVADKFKEAAAEYERKKIERAVNESFAHMLVKPLSCETCSMCARKCGMARQLRNLVGNNYCRFMKVELS